MSVAVQSPDESQKLAEVSSEVSAVVARAREIEVGTDAQAQDATAFLAELKAAKDRSERARRFLIDPLNAHVKKINDQIKADIAPLDEANQLVRRKVLDYRSEQERLRVEEQARLDAARKMEEEAAAAERRHAEEEAAAAEREAAEAARERQALLAAAKNKRRKQLADMSPGELRELVRNGVQDDMMMAVEEINARDQAQKAQERAANARREAEEALQRSIAAQAAPPPRAAAPAKLAAAAGSAAVRRDWKATIIDEAQVPRRYLIIDMKLINADVRAGVREIPGCRIEQVQGLAVRAHG